MVIKTERTFSWRAFHEVIPILWDKGIRLRTDSSCKTYQTMCLNIMRYMYFKYKQYFKYILIDGIFGTSIHVGYFIPTNTYSTEGILQLFRNYFFFLQFSKSCPNAVPITQDHAVHIIRRNC